MLANSIPKSGTNLLVRLLYLTPTLYRPFKSTITQPRSAIGELSCTKPSQIIVGHLKYDDLLRQEISHSQIKHLLMVRDPRAIAVSNVSYITHIDKKHRLHIYYSKQLNNIQERLQATLDGIPSEQLNGNDPSLPLSQHIDGYIRWLNAGSCILVRYEDLVGSQGGGSSRRQLITVEQILDYLGLECREEEVLSICNKLYAKVSRTFRSGQINSWRSELTPELQRLCNSRLEAQIEALGYRL